MLSAIIHVGRPGLFIYYCVFFPSTERAEMQRNEVDRSEHGTDNDDGLLLLLLSYELYCYVPAASSLYKFTLGSSFICVDVVVTIVTLLPFSNTVRVTV